MSSPLPPPESRRSSVPRFVAKHEEIKNLIQSFAILVAGCWIAGIWIYENWAARYLARPLAELTVSVDEHGQTRAGDDYIRVTISVKNASKREFFNYANALTVRSVQNEPSPITNFNKKQIDAYINDIENVRRPWIIEEFHDRKDDVIAYSQFMSQGQRFLPSERVSFSVVILLPPKTSIVKLSAMLAYGASRSVLNPFEATSGRLAIDKHGNLTSCISNSIVAKKRGYQTSCNTDYERSKFYVRHSYGESSFALTR